MQLTVTVVSPAIGQQLDVVIDAVPATAVAEIAIEIDLLMHGEAATAAVLAAPALFVGYHRVPGDMRLADSPIMDGCVVSIGDPAGCRRSDPVGVAEIRVVSGPAAGTLHRLPFGTADIGGPVPGGGVHAAAAADIVIGDPAIPAVALRVRVGRDGCQLAPFDGVPVLLDRRPLDAAAHWRPGQQVTVGRTLLDLVPYQPPDAALHPAGDGAGLEFNRPPRLLPPGQAMTFALPSPPGQPERRPVPILMAIVPVVLGVAMAYFLRQVYMLAMAAFSPVMLLGSYVSDRRHGRKSHARQEAEYREHKSRVERDARHAVSAERLQRRHDCPDPATVLSVTSGPRRRLWERRRTDPDYLLLRIGTADLPAAVELTDPTQDEHRRRRFWRVPDAPVTLSLTERAVLGVAGPGDVPRAAGRWLVGQIAALHSPQDVQICILTDSTGQAAWEWARWLPHGRPVQGQNCAALFGVDAETVAARIAELQAIITGRQQALAGRAAGQARFARDIVVVFDGSRKLRSLPGVIGVLREGAQVGVYSICLDGDERLLPAECQAVVTAGPDGMLVVQQMNSPAIRPVRPEYVIPAWAELLARSIAPVRDVSGGDETTGLPQACRLLDVIGLEPPTAGAIAARWQAGGRSTHAVIGACYDGPFGIDLRKDGPHALIAGTTGAGKSELLQTLIASLACVNRPDAMTFVLVDYKGGSAFSGCVDLPHVVGMVTDLDAHLTQRALTSLGAELTRRERILAAAGAKDIEDYTTLLGRQARAARPDSRPEPMLPEPMLNAPMPRLVIVIDEFASLARDLPDFVTGLVSIAQRGRSLGLHLILATQRPSGVVSADIRANTNLRIALRVTDATESADVIEAPDAAAISRATPGRGYVRLGHASLVPFQAGRVGGHRPGTAAASRPQVIPADWSGLGRPDPPRPPRRPADDEITDLKVLVGQIQQAAAALGIGAQPSPWLGVLPRTLLLADLPASPGTGADLAQIPVPFGLIDLPDLQQQRPAGLDLDTFGHLMAVGAPRSGRSQLLRTIAASIAVSCSRADVHLYGIDCGNGALLPIAGLPHCGAVVTRSQAERASRLIARLGAELERRQELLAEGGFANLTEQRAATPPADRLPRIIVLLDRWEGFTVTFGEAGGGAMADVITQILAEGASAGMHLVMTGDRSLLAGRIAAMCEDKLAFKLAEKDDYALIGLRPRDLPDDIPPGRAYRAGTGTETQVALIAPGPSGPDQAAALQRIAVWATERDAGIPRPMSPFRVDVLPSRITFDDAWKLRLPVAARPLWGLAGVGGDELTALGPDLADGTPAFIVAGPPRSGRSTVLTSMTLSFLAGGAQVILVTPRPSPLRSLVSRPGVIRSFTGPDLGEDELIAAIAALTAPGVVVLDDADLLADCDAGGQLSKIITRGSGRTLALVLAGDPDRLASGFGGWQADARRARRGCLTAPQTLPEGELIGARLTHARIGHPVKPGRALLSIGDGTLTAITVPAG